MSLGRAEAGHESGAAARTLHRYEINGVTLDVYDEDASLAADRVAGELRADAYGLDGIPFRPGDVAIDIGAHIGLVSLYLAKRWPFLRIHAFEPYEPNWRNCVENLRINGGANVQLFRKAVTADGRPITLRALPSNTGGATAMFDMPGATTAPPVESLTLHEVFERALLPGQRCRLLKVDCEGMEYELLPSPVLDRVDFLAAEFHEGPLCCRESQRPIDPGGAGALADRCSRFFEPERMRIAYSGKSD